MTAKVAKVVHAMKVNGDVVKEIADHLVQVLQAVVVSSVAMTTKAAKVVHATKDNGDAVKANADHLVLVRQAAAGSSVATTMKVVKDVHATKVNVVAVTMIGAAVHMTENVSNAGQDRVEAVGEDHASQAVARKVKVVPHAETEPVAVRAVALVGTNAVAVRLLAKSQGAKVHLGAVSDKCR